MEQFEKVCKGLEVHIKPNSRCVGCPYPNNGLCGDQLYSDALALIRQQQERINVLEAQEPKPPRLAVAYDKIFYACDNCGKSLLVVANAEGINSLNNMPKYCPECGKAVKWDG